MQRYLAAFFYMELDDKHYRPIEETMEAIRFTTFTSPTARTVVLCEEKYADVFRSVCSQVYTFERNPKLKYVPGYVRVRALDALQKAYPDMPLLSLDGDAFMMRDCAPVFDLMRKEKCLVAAVPRKEDSVLIKLGEEKIELSRYMPYNNGVVFSLPEARLYAHVLDSIEQRSLQYWYMCQVALNEVLKQKFQETVLNLAPWFNYPWSDSTRLPEELSIAHAKGSEGEKAYSYVDLVNVYRALKLRKDCLDPLREGMYSVGCAPMGDMDEFLGKVTIDA